MAHTGWTIRLLFRSWLIVALSLLPLSTAFSLDEKAFAQSLEKDGDWYRAIGEWQEIRFEANSETSFDEANQSILLDYWTAKQYGLFVDSCG